MAKKSVCKIDGCGKLSKARGFCDAHWRRWRLYGDPTHIARVAAGKPLEWLKDNIAHQADECLTWPFSRSKATGGYGQTVWNGRKSKASRVMCILAHGEPPSLDHVAAHLCGNGHLGCVNPRHLRWATCSENSADTVAHGRSTRGEVNPMNIVTPEQVLEIRRLCEAKTLKQDEIGEIYGIGQSTVSAIYRRENWEWLK